MSSGFVHLHLHTEFSLADGIVRIKPLVQAVAAAGMPAVAITDLGNLFGMVKFYRAALAAGVKPIIGAEVWVEPEAADADGEPTRLVLLCADDAGYGSLCALLTAGYAEGQRQGVPVLRREWLVEHATGLLALSGPAGDVGRALRAADPPRARRLLAFWQQAFPGRLYLEVQRTGRPGEEDHLHAAVELAAESGVPVVAGNDVRFLEADDFDAHEARVCIHDGHTLDDPHRPGRYSPQQYLRCAEEMVALFADLPEALENSLQIARRCNLTLTLGRNALPDFPLPAGTGIEDHLSEQTLRGLAARLARFPAEGGEERRRIYHERLELELGVIRQMGFPGYFLIVADFIRWARQQGIPVGPGRGSGAGSLVAYSLGITDLDPLRYDLLFERFLNPERVSMPDFDIDFCMERRDEVIDYVAERYGREKVSQIATHGTMAARAVVRDVGRVLSHAYGYVDRIAKLIPFEIGMTLEKALVQEEELARLHRDDEEVRALLELAAKLEGLCRNVGKHAGGVVIAPSALTDFCPLYCEPGGQGLVTQFDKDDVEAVGLVKFDFLGLRTLTIIDWTVKAVNAVRREEGVDELAIEALPLDDAPTFELLKGCRTTAVFQLESRGMKDLIRRLQPDSFEDIIALVALFRPGPLQSGMVDDFIDRKHGRKPVAYPTRELHHDELKPVLKPTYGVILYQEQVMQIAQVLGGYSLGAADLLRRAMGKKKAEEMARQREGFLRGATGRGLAPAHAAGLFDLMEKFAGYGFNKSHSAAYALLSYQTAWLKTHYPAQFMAAVLSSDMDNTDKVVILIDECRNLGLTVEPPDVNRSGFRFRARDRERVVYGLGAVKGVGQSAIEALLAERDAGGPFRDLFDLCRRLDLRRVNRRVLEALIRSGSLDALEPNRATAMQRLPAALRAAEQHLRNREQGQDDMFGLSAPAAATEEPPVDVPAALAEWDEEARLAAEKETLGLYLTGHPITRYESELECFVSARLGRAIASGPAGGGDGGGRRRSDEPSVVLAGLVMALRARNTQRGRMGFATLDDRTGRLEVVFGPDEFQRYRHLLGKDRLLVVEGRLGYDDFSDGYQVRAQRAMDITEARERFARRLVVPVRADQAANGLVSHLQEILEPFREGGCLVWLDYRGSRARARLRLGEQWRVRPSDELLKRLSRLADEGEVRMDY